MSPTIGSGKDKKTFPYSAKGEAAAKAESKKTGKPMVKAPSAMDMAMEDMRGGKGPPPPMKKKR